MLKPFTFTVQVEVERTEGKFVSRDAIAQELFDSLETANPDTLSVEDSEYEVVMWDVISTE